MASLNKVFIMGNLTRDPELRYTTSGTAVCNFSIAIGRKYKTREGEMKEEVVFVNNITAWARLAEICGEYLQKGSPVFVEGRLYLNSYEDKETKIKINQLRVTAERIQFLGRKSDAGGGGEATPEKEKKTEETPEGGGDEVPF